MRCRINTYSLYFHSYSLQNRREAEGESQESRKRTEQHPGRKREAEAINHGGGPDHRGRSARAGHEETRVWQSAVRRPGRPRQRVLEHDLWEKRVCEYWSRVQHG